MYVRTMKIFVASVRKLMPVPGLATPFPFGTPGRSKTALTCEIVLCTYSV